jgi:histidine triad (HIT) family protein
MKDNFPAVVAFLTDLERLKLVSRKAYISDLSQRESSAPGDIVYQDDLTVAFIDPRQHNPGHVLVVPRKHINDIRQLDPRIGAALMDTLIKITNAVAQAFPSEGMSVWHSIGPAAFQEVPHMHMHVHPRRLGDGLLRVYPGEPVDADPGARASYAERLRKELAGQGAK